MYSESRKMQLFATWMLVVCLTALAIETKSVANWIVMACLAVVPPLVAGKFWRTPARTISESIRDARR